jgi:hypothetical protein
MAFADPQSITISGATTSLPRTGAGIGAGAFGSNDGAITIDVRHAYGKRTRRTVGVVTKKYSTDPARPDQNIPVSATVRLTVDAPVQGYTAADLEALLVGFMANLTAGTNANIKKLLGGEN